jgi:uncharacterized SAM-binding protein YcdF (DUF218 family)
VLSGSDLGLDVLGYSSYWRAVYAVLMERRNHYRQILVSGGGNGPKTTARLMADFLVASGVPQEIIRIEDESSSTRESAVFTKRALGDETGCNTLLTSDYHMFRASRTFRQAGIDIRPNPIPDIRKRATRWYWRAPAVVELSMETAKIGYYKWHGWI